MTAVKSENMHILTISRLKQVSNTFYFTFTVRPEAKATKNGFRIRNVVPATEEEARRILERKDAQALLSTAVVSK